MPIPPNVQFLSNPRPMQLREIAAISDIPDAHNRVMKVTVRVRIATVR
jgi:hypothetical protein